MSFKISKTSALSTESPEALLRDLRSRKIPGLLAHQADVLREYVEKTLTHPDVAFQLPTGSGKTLVGVLLGEWKRRKFDERVVYLCPTIQLVNQVAEQAHSKYGITVNTFTGKQSQYSPKAKGEFQNGETIAITTYSGLFNTNPFFDSPHTIILDDVHSAENYIANHWTVCVERFKNEHKALHSALTGLLRPVLSTIDYRRLTGPPSGLWDKGWAEKISTPALTPLIPELVSILDSHVTQSDLRYSWSVIRDHLHACHLYLSIGEILIRPVLPPTNTHRPFVSARQRVYMSATLGEGGDLERLTGRKEISRLQVPAGWDKQGIGRRLFFLPERSLGKTDAKDLVLEMISTAGRALILVPDDQAAEAAEKLIEEKLGFATFDAREIEQSKEPFISVEEAVAVIANRYDGIDFPDEDCRLLIVEALPRATNLQERFFIARMGALALYNDRILTRIVQAFGRCTRSATDFAAIVIRGEELNTYLMTKERRDFLHPELQAELQFGIEQSKDISAAEFIDNLKIFFDQGKDWSDADSNIVSVRHNLTQQQLPGTSDLRRAVQHEVEYQYALWEGDFEQALEHARKALAELRDSELRGYRALWSYLAGAAAWLGYKEGRQSLESVARLHFNDARSAAPGLRWLVGLSRYAPTPTGSSEIDARVMTLIERLELTLETLGISHDQRYAEEEGFILNNLSLADADKFEEAHMRLGRLLGFDAGNKDTSGAPDPWWIVDDDLCFIFEDHSDGKEGASVKVNKARQAATHPNWVRENLPLSQSATIASVLVSPAQVADLDALPHLKAVYLWRLDEFREWARAALSVVREVRRTFPGSGDLIWRANAAQAYIDNKMDPASILNYLRSCIAADLLKP
jgi:Type III restriction enzyme, res subunit/Helicase C-terminal domain